MTEIRTLRSALVTGGTGFIGRALIRLLLQQGLAVTLLTRAKSGNSPAVPPDTCERITFDPSRPETIAQALRGRSFSVVFHLAAAGVNPSDRQPALLTRANVLLAATITTWCIDSDTPMIAAGSSAEYAPVHPGIALTEDMPLTMSDLYGATKAAGTLVACATAASAGGRLAVLRLFGSYGPGEASHRLFPSLANRLRAGEKVPLTTGLQVRDFMFVGDTVAALVAAARHLELPSGAPVVLNLCTGIGVTVRQFAETVCDLMGADRALLDFGAIPMRAGELHYVVGDPTRLFTAVGWRHGHRLEHGISATLTALREPAA